MDKNNEKIVLNYDIKQAKGLNRKTKKPQINTWLNYNNLEPADKSNINSIFHGFVGKKRTNPPLSFSTSKPEDKNFENTKNILDSYRYIEKLGKYEMPPIDVMYAELLDGGKDTLSKEEQENIEKSTDELWLKFMKEIKKPEVQQLIKSMGQYYLLDKTFGWRYAASNVLRILSIKEDATFVQTRHQWNTRFNRRVIDGATKLGIVIPKVLDTSVSDEEINNALKRAGYSYDTTYDDLSVQQKTYIDIDARNDYSNNFFMRTVYDITDTELIDPDGEDIWADTIGYDNNLTGHLNKHALDYKAKQNNVSAEDLSLLYNNEEGNIDILCYALEDGISTNYKDLTIDKSKRYEGNKDMMLSSFEKNLTTLADYLIENKYKIVRAENRQQGIAIVVSIVLCLTKLSPESVAKKLSNSELTEDSYFELRTIINSIITMMNKHLPKDESTRYLAEMQIPTLGSVDSLLDMLGINREDLENANDKENDIIDIKENFFKYFNKINNYER